MAKPRLTLDMRPKSFRRARSNPFAIRHWKTDIADNLKIHRKMLEVELPLFQLLLSADEYGSGGECVLWGWPASAEISEPDLSVRADERRQFTSGFVVMITQRKPASHLSNRRNGFYVYLEGPSEVCQALSQIN